MKNSFVRFLSAITILFTLPTSFALPNRFLSDTFYSNPLLLNGRSVSYDQLNMAMSGSVSIVKGNPGSENAVKVPFTVSLKRAGLVINTNDYIHNHPVTEFELRDVLKNAWAGDEIIMNPVNQFDSAGQQKMIVAREQLIPVFNWLIGLMPRKADGC